MISSFGGRRLKEISAIAKKPSYRREQGLYLVEGVKMFEELPQEETVFVLASESFYDSCDNKIRARLDKSRAELCRDEIFASVSDTKTPQGIIAVARQRKYSFEDMLGRESVALLILETIQDPGNLGTMFRAGEGAGISGIIMDKSTADIYNPKAIRSTMGSVFRVPFIYADDIYETVEKLKMSGIKTYAASLANSRDYDEADYTKASAFIIGNEARGLSSKMIETADLSVHIPMLGRVESLNAASAASILMYEMSRQRRRR